MSPGGAEIPEPDHDSAGQAPGILDAVRPLRRLILLLVVLWLIGEVVAIPVVNRIVAGDVAGRTHDAASVKASVGDFPIVARLVLTKRVNHVNVTLERVTGQAVPFAHITLAVRDVAIQRSSLLHRKPHVTSVGSGTITAVVDLSDISPLAARVASSVHMEGRTLLLGGLPVRVNVQSPFLPCLPAAQLSGQQVILSCTVTHVPTAWFQS